MKEGRRRQEVLTGLFEFHSAADKSKGSRWPKEGARSTMRRSQGRIWQPERGKARFDRAPSRLADSRADVAARACARDGPAAHGHLHRNQLLYAAALGEAAAAGRLCGTGRDRASELWGAGSKW